MLDVIRRKNSEISALNSDLEWYRNMYDLQAEMHKLLLLRYGEVFTPEVKSKITLILGMIDEWELKHCRK